MRRVYVVRAAITAAGAFGVMLDDELSPFAVTLERTFTDGKPILAPGVYRCSQRVFHRGRYMTFEIHVDGHSDILFHIANLETQLEGCIGVGSSFTPFNGMPGIADSKRGFDKFWQMYKEDTELELNVSNATLIAA